MSSITEKYILAARARAKLTREANKQDHNLRILVGHANLLDGLMESIQNTRYESKMQVPEFKSVQFQPFTLPNETTVTLIEDDDSSDEEDDDYEEEEGVTEIYYSSDDSDFDSDDEEDDDEEFDVSEVDYKIDLHRVHSSNFKSLPTIDELSEQEYEELEESSELEASETESDDEADITDLKTPSLNYSSSTEDEEEYDIESEEEKPISLGKNWYNAAQQHATEVLWSDAEHLHSQRDTQVVF